MANEISNSEDILDVRNIIERFEELAEERADLQSGIDDAEGDEEKAQAVADLADWDEDYAEELKTITELLRDLAGNGGDHEWKGDWYPVTLIRDSYFEDYAQELTQDIGDLPQDIPGYLVIDWEATAKNLQQDYSSVEFDGVTYWYR